MTFSFALLVVALHAAPRIDSDTAAAIELEQREAELAVDAKYGHKKPSDLTSAERLAKIRDLREADQAVLDKHGVNTKDWARAAATKTRAEAADQKQAVSALDQTRHDAAAKPKNEEPHEVAIQRGISDDNPVLLEDHDGSPIIEKGLPPDVVADQAEAQAADATLPKDKAGPSAPAAKKSPAPKSDHSNKKKKKAKHDADE